MNSHGLSLSGWRDTLFVNAADPIVLKDLQGRVIDLNSEAERAFGWKKEELVGQPISVTVPRESHAHVEELLRRCRSGEEIRDVPGLRKTRDNQVYPVLMTLTLLNDERQQPFAIATLTKTVAKQCDSLQEQEARLSSVFEAAIEGIIVVDEQGSIDSLNTSAERMFGTDQGS